jgi:cytidine deaminase
VGAALRTGSGRVFTGCNVENAAYPLTTCAERTALTKAVSEGEREFEAIAVVTATGASPCGACRQILREFGGPDGRLRVIIADTAGNTKIFTIAELLPEGFTPGQLG